MDNKKSSDSAQADDPYKPQLHIQPGTKVIQPSAALLDELKNQNTETPAQPAKPVTAEVPKKVDVPPAQKPLVTQPVYPEATKDIDPSAQFARPAGTQDKSRDKVLISPKRIFIIRSVSGLLLLCELIALRYQFSIVHTLHGSVNALGLLATLFIIALLIGILFLKDAARAIFVFVASASLLLAVFGLLSLYVQTHKSNVDESKSQQLSRQEIDTSINSTEKNNQYTQEQKDLIVKNLKNQPGYSAINDAKLKVKQYGLYAFIFLITVGPIVFYTRPKIKDAFN